MKRKRNSSVYSTKAIYYQNEYYIKLIYYNIRGAFNLRPYGIISN